MLLCCAQGLSDCTVLYKRQYFVFLSYVTVGRLFGTGILIILYLCIIAAHLTPEV